MSVFTSYGAIGYCSEEADATQLASHGKVERFCHKSLVITSGTSIFESRNPLPALGLKGSTCHSSFPFNKQTVLTPLKTNRPRCMTVLSAVAEGKTSHRFSFAFIAYISFCFDSFSSPVSNISISSSTLSFFFNFVTMVMYFHTLHSQSKNLSHIFFFCRK